MARETGRIVWHELLTPDVETAQRFYRDLLGWEARAVEARGGRLPDDPGRRRRARRLPANTPGQPHTAALAPPRRRSRTSIPSSAACARSAAPCAPSRSTSATSGRLAIVQDREGAEFAVVAQTGERPRPEGVFLWDELLVDDLDGARQFYRRVLGWRDEDAGEGYALLYADDHAVAGVTRRPAEVTRPTWLTYVATESVECRRRAGTRARRDGPDRRDGVRGRRPLGDVHAPPGAAAGLLQPSAG